MTELTDNDKQRIADKSKETGQEGGYKNLPYEEAAFRLGYILGAEYATIYEREQQAKGPYTVSEGSLSSYINIFLDGKIWLGSVERGLAIEICNKLNHRLKLLELEAERSELLSKLQERLDRCRNVSGYTSGFSDIHNEIDFLDLLLNSLKTK